MILAGDIGGTKTRLAFFDSQLIAIREQRFVSKDHASLDEIVGRFVDETGLLPDCACFGIAGPVKDNRSKTTNLPWTIDARELIARLGTSRIALINDLMANAYGLAALSPDDFVILKEGTAEPSGNTAVISAGTGLGEAGMTWDGEAYRPVASEGGHASFAPRTEPEIDLLRYLTKRYGPVSWERVLSGPGLHNIFDSLVASGFGNPPRWLTEQILTGDPSAAISQAAMDGSCAVSIAALDRFVSLYGAEAGNVALKFLATGGVYVGGGIGPKIVERLRSGSFAEAFVDKGPMRPLLEAIPVRLITNEKTALLGAARFAASLV